MAAKANENKENERSVFKPDCQKFIIRNILNQIWMNYMLILDNLN